MRTSEEWLSEAVRFENLANGIQVDNLTIATDDYGREYFAVRSKTAFNEALKLEQSNG